jgi:DNA gyrase subunit A
MATNIPPHNMREVIEGVIWTIESATSEAPPTLPEKQRKLLELIRGRLPDRRLHRRPQRHSPGVPHRARHGDHAREGRDRGSKKGDRSSIVIDAIPYQVNKAKLIERIAELVREKTIEGISDIRDESDRDGMRIVIDLKRGEVGESSSTTSTSTPRCRAASASSCWPSSAGGPRCCRWSS